MKLLQCILTIGFSLSCSVCVALDYLSSGFAHVTLNSDSKTTSFQVEDYYRVPISLDSFQFSNLPSYIKLKSSKFIPLNGRRTNNHDVYFNGKFYLFFLANTESHGTWLLGEQLGVDSGIAYLRPEVHTIVPLHMESSTTPWKFLKDGQWTEERDVEVVPVGDSSLVRYAPFNAVRYFHGSSGDASQTVLLMVPIDRASKEDKAHVQRQDSTLRFLPSLEIPLPSAALSAEQYPLFWNLDTQQWTSFTLLFVIPMAAPVRVAADKSATKEESAKLPNGDIVHLVGHEMSGRGWRLFLRVNDKDAGGDLELKLDLTNAGLGDNYRVKSVRKKDLSIFRKKVNKKMMTINVGAYLWLWFRGDVETLGGSRYLAFTKGDFLLKCVGVSSEGGAERFVFEYFHSHRRVAMDRSVLSMHTSLVTALWNPDTNLLDWSLDGSPLIVDAVFPLGPDPVTWLQDYLISHENFLSPGLSSCFMYHGGLSMPQQLIYAAEIVCVLIGSKPMTMIQYTTSADHQWKFPLVPELTQSILAGRLLLDPLASSIDVQYNTYQVTSETVIFYRTKQRPMLDLILPNNTAQALHIVPFPSEAGEGDTAKMDSVLREQIYNSWWNGYLLGYPTRFIDSYLTSFHTKLSAGAIQEEMQRAKRDVQSHFQKHPHLQRSEIKYGSDVNLLADEAIRRHFTTIF